MDRERKVMDQIRKLLHVAFTTEQEEEASAYFLAARSLARGNLYGRDEDEAGVVQAHAVDLTCAWRRDGTAESFRARSLRLRVDRAMPLLASGSTPVVLPDDAALEWGDGEMPEIFTAAATEPAVPSAVHDPGTGPRPGTPQGYHVRSELD